MAKNIVYAGVGAYNRVRDLGRTIQSGEPVIDNAGAPAVAETASADAVGSNTFAGSTVTISGFPIGGVGLVDQEVTLAYDVTAEFPVADFDGTAPVPGTIAQGAAVNYKTSNNKLTTAAVGAGVVAYGTVDYTPDYDTTRGLLPVKIGA